MKILVLIPARIGSVSIRKKNLQKLNNYPLLIRAAKKIKKSKHKLDLFISTESRLIMSVCNKFKYETTQSLRLMFNYSTDPFICCI